MYKLNILYYLITFFITLSCANDSPTKVKDIMVEAVIQQWEQGGTDLGKRSIR